MNDEERWIRAELLVDHADAASAHLWDLGALGIELQDGQTFMEGGLIPHVPEGRSRLIAFFPDDDPEKIKSMIVESLRHPNPDEVSVTYFDDLSWKTAWQKFFKPVRLSKRAIVGPPWEAFSPPTSWTDSQNNTHPLHNGVAITINPGLAFGTGTHETTQLVATILDDLLEKIENESLPPIPELLDVGCGSGILSILAYKLGIPSVTGIDIDADAIDSANETLLEYGLTDISLTTTPLSEISHRYPLLLANILGHILLREKENLAAVTAPQGRIIVSGVLEREADAFSKEFESVGFSETYRASKGEWAAFIFQLTGESSCDE